MRQESDFGLHALFKFIGEHADAALVLATVIGTEGRNGRSLRDRA